MESRKSVYHTERHTNAIPDRASDGIQVGNPEEPPRAVMTAESLLDAEIQEAHVLTGRLENRLHLVIQPQIGISDSECKKPGTASGHELIACSPLTGHLNTDLRNMRELNARLNSLLITIEI